MISYEYSKAIAEVLDILEHTNKSDVDKISPTFMKFLKDNASKEYIPNLDHSKRIKDMQLSDMTIGILCVINSKFWCTNEQKKEFDEILKRNEIKYQEKLGEKYDLDNMFKYDKYVQNEDLDDIEEKHILKQKETFLRKLKKIIFKVLHIKF